MPLNAAFKTIKLPSSPWVSFGGRHRRKLDPNADLKQPVPLAVQRLFQAVPKTELHLHLGGSTPLPLLRQFMKENGLSRKEVARVAKVSDRFVDLDDFLATYYKVPAHVKTPDQFYRATRAVVAEAAAENVRVIEVRTSILKKGGAPEAIVAAVEKALKDGVEAAKAHYGFEMLGSLIILAQRAGTPEDSLESARLTVELARKPGSLIRGFDLAGSEGQHSVDKHAAALRYMQTYGKPQGLGLTIHAGETPMSDQYSGVDSIKKALALGADRIGHGIQMMQDPELLAYSQVAQLPIELCPWSNVQIQAVNGYGDHPLKAMLSKGLNVSLSTDNRMMSKITLTEQLGQLWAHHQITSWEQIKLITRNGVGSAFLTPIEKTRALKNVDATFAAIEQNPLNQRTIARYFKAESAEVKSPQKRLNKFA